MRISLTILLSLYLSAAYAATIPLGLNPGQLKVISQTGDLCTDGPLKIVGEKGEELLMVGAVITFTLPAEKKLILVKASDTECAEEVESTVKDKTLTNISTTHSCPASLKNLERKVVETLTVTGRRLKYLKESPQEKKVECVFEWSADEKK